MVSTDPLGNVAAFFGLPGAPATSAPSLGALPLLTRLTLEDVFTGTGPAPVTNATAVVTGLFNQVLREDPSAEELQNYLGVLALTGVNGVVAGLYSSTQFRQQEVANYYLELLNRPATQDEISWGASRLMWGTPEPLFAASIAGTPEFYSASASGGGPFGPTPTANSFVNLLYRTLLGEAADPTTAAIYVQKLQTGLPSGFIARDFVMSDTFRTVKVDEIYSVLDQTPDPTAVAGYVGNWLFSGGLAGIATSLMATSANVQKIEAGQVALPAYIAQAAQLQTLLLAPYTDTAGGFVSDYGTLIGNCSAGSSTCANSDLYLLLTTGGTRRGLPNTSLTPNSITANVATLIPTQNEIDIAKSLEYPLTEPASLTLYFAGGVIEPPSGNPLITAGSGTYIVDGHHRWSAIFIVNPSTQVAAVDLGYVPTPQDALKEAQVGVAAVQGYLPQSSAAPERNLYTMSEQTFDSYVISTIQGGSTPAAVMAVFDHYLDFSLKPTIDPYQQVANYLWGNVLRMREFNPYIPGATSREVMPQTDPLPVTQTKFSSGALSYTFPTISYLG